MDKMRVRNLNLVPSYALIAVLFLLGAMFVADFEREYIETVQMETAQKYTEQVETFNDYKVWDKQGKVYEFTKADSNKIRRLDFFYYIFPHMAYICSTFLASLVYYRIKLKKPLRFLSDATVRIAENDLDFTIEYEKNDEMGRLCTAFEKMRSSLEESRRENWRQMEERKRLNASFSHDLRTPLTVLEGNMEMLQKYSGTGALSEKDINEIYSVMDIQLKRMSRQVTVDLEIVLQVCENLLANAIRYAKTSVEVICKQDINYLLISVSDDGAGFKDDDIRIVTDPFYTTEKKSKGEHFGLGLNICKILCQRHEGDIILKNRKSGGASVTVSFGMKMEK